MSEAEYDTQPILLDNGAEPDIEAQEVRTFWRPDDDSCHVDLGDGTVVVSTRTPSPTADTVKADIRNRINDGMSSPVLASHLDLMGFRAALLAWAQEGM